MAMLVNDPGVEERIKAERRAWGADRYDEVWEGVYMMTPMPDNEHQKLVLRLAVILEEVVERAGVGEVFPGVNLAAPDGDWEQDYRVPDVAVFLHGGEAGDCGTHWRGGADLVVEITSPEDRTRVKIPFYQRLGVKELLIVDRQSWSLELYRLQKGRLKKAGQSTAAGGGVVTSKSVGLRFRLIAGDPRPSIEVEHKESGRRWVL